MMEDLLKLGFRRMSGICIDRLSCNVYFSAQCELEDSAVVVDVFPDNPAKGKVSVVVRGTYLRNDCVQAPFEHTGNIATSYNAKSALEKAFACLEKDLSNADYYVDRSKSIHQVWTRKMLDAIKGLDD